RALPAAVDALAISASGWVAIASGKQVTLISARPQARDTHTVAIPDQANLVGFSGDGRWLAACTTTGALRLWSLLEQGPPAARPLENDETTGRTTTFAFSPGGLR